MKKNKIRNRHKIIILAMVAVLLIGVNSILCKNSVASAADVTFAGGSGTEADPYIIETVAQLDAVRNKPSASYKLNADIEFIEADFAESGAFYNNGKGWVPIYNFKGIFDGNGHVIRNIVINSADNNAGIFGECSIDSKISNLGIENGNIMSSGYAGGIAGVASGGVIENCYYSGTISGVYAGGILGEISGDVIVRNCYNVGHVTSSSAGGGIVGFASEGVIENCYSSGTIYGADVGGILGENGGNIIVKDCYNAGYVTNYQSSAGGGIVGSIEKEGGAILNCYNIGRIRNTSYSGEIVGRNTKGSITNCYYIEDKLPGVGKGTDTATASSPEEFTLQLTFTGFDFENVWEIDGSGEYKFPTLRELPNDVTFGYTENFTDFSGGYGIKSSPYIITNMQQLNNVRNYLDASFKLANDIQFDLNDFKADGAFYNEGKGWEPIDNFKGTFDGNGYSIKGIIINRAEEDFVALFRKSDGTIKRLGIYDSTIIGKSAASICGENGGRVTECYNAGSIYGSTEAGGIVVWNSASWASQVADCYNTGRVSAEYAGGIVGYTNHNFSGGIFDCYNIGFIKGKSSTGGIIGWASEGNTTISDSYYLNYGYCSKGNNNHKEGSANCEGAITIEGLGEETTFAGFDFDSTWTIDPNAEYWMPILKNVRNYAATPAENNEDFAGGYGTYDSPYLIKTSKQLDNIRKDLYASYKLENDIVFDRVEFSKSGAFYNNGKRWNPIGTTTEQFRGKFDGGGYRIVGLIIDRADESYCGLFAYNEGWIINLNISGFKITGSREGYCGGITGNNSGIIDKCSNRGEFNALNSNAGAICGENRGKIRECFNTGDISAKGSVGGIAYQNGSAGEVSECYNSGKIISHEGSAGGIVCDNELPTIRNCYNTGDIYAEDYAGGIAALNRGGSGSNNYGILTCYNIGTVRGSTTNGISQGYESSYVAYIKDSYSLDISDRYGIEYGTICNIKTMMNKNTYSGFDFGTVWDFDDESDYKFPTLRNVKNYAIAPTENKTDFAGGYGTKSSPYIIKTKEHLNNVRNNLNSYFKLCSNITFDESDFEEGGAFYNDRKRWEPIGNLDEKFWGYFDGNGHTINNLSCNRASEDYVGLFGFSNGNVKNLKIANAEIKGGKYIGLIAGCMKNGNISNCEARGLIYANCNDNKGTYVGGITGCVYGGEITDSVSNVSIESDKCEYAVTLGGIVGYSGRGYCVIKNCVNYKDLSGAYDCVGGILGDSVSYIKIIECQNYGLLRSKGTVGGIAGRFSLYREDAVIDGCVNMGEISGGRSAGGIAGSNCGVVRNSYNTGKVSSNESGYAAGGIMGECNIISGKMENCYNIGDVHTDNGHAGGIIGSVGSFTEASINSCYNIGNVSCDSGNAGAIVGKGSVTIANCFYLNNVDQAVGSGTGNATKCTEEQMQNAETYGDAFDFDYDMIWAISDTAEYRFPVLTEVVNPELQYTLSTNAKQGVPATPMAISYGNGQITIAAVKGQKYVCVPNTDAGYSGVIPALSSEEWKLANTSTVVFSGLTQGKTYKIYTYIPASGSQSASYISLPLEITLKTLGDLDGDGKINAADVLYLKRALAGWEGYELNFSASNTNGDDKLDQADVMVLERHIAGWNGYESLPVTGKTA